MSPSAIAARAEDNPRRFEALKNQKATSLGFPAVRGPFETQPLGVVVPPAPSSSPILAETPREPSPPTLPKSPGRAAPGPRGKTPTTPPLTPRHPTPVAPVPIVRPPAKSAPVVADEEKTDLGEAPPIVAVELAPTAVSGPVDKPAQRSGGMRASEILAAIPAGDWTMTPEESVPHPLPPELKAPAPVVVEPTPAPAPPPGPPTGDWTISLDPDTHGWSEPEKVPKGGAASTSGNPVVAVASDKPINVVRWDDKPTGIGESKIEIDSALMEPVGARPPTGGTGAPPAPEATAPHGARPELAKVDTLPPPLGPLPPHPAGFVPQGAAAFGQPPPRPPRAPYPAASAMDMRGFGSSAALPAPPHAAKRKKMIAMAIGAGAVAVGAIVILVLTVSGKETPKPQAKTDPGSAGSAISIKATPSVDAADPDPGAGSQQIAEPAGSDSETPAPAPADAAVEQVVEQPTPPVEDPAPAPAGTCKVQLTSVPAGADIYVAKRKLGTTPSALDLPCGQETRVSLRKSKFANTARSFTPKAGKPNKFTFKLTRNLFLVKVTSTPAGATVTTGGKSVGVTPTAIKLPAYDATTLTLTKPGYSALKSRVTPRQNNASHHVTLKKGR